MTEYGKLDLTHSELGTMPTVCPNCGHKLRSVSGPRAPKPGDYMITACCQRFGRYTEVFQLDLLSGEQEEEFFEEHPGMREQVERVRMVARRNRGLVHGP